MIGASGYRLRVQCWLPRLWVLKCMPNFRNMLKRYYLPITFSFLLHKMAMTAGPGQPGAKFGKMLMDA